MSAMPFSSGDDDDYDYNDDDTINSDLESLRYSYSPEPSASNSYTNRLQQLVPHLNNSPTSAASFSSSLASKDDFNILVTGSKCTGKSSLCETLLLLLAKDENVYNFEYIDVNHLRNQFNKLSLPLSDNTISMVREKLDGGFVIIEDTNFDMYHKRSFSVIFIVKAEDDELENRLICHGDFHTPYNDFHIMEPYNSVCEKFPYTKYNKIFILDNTLDRHLHVNARFIKKWIDECMSIFETTKQQVFDSDGESHRSDSDESDANETLIHTDGKLLKSNSRVRDTQVLLDSDGDGDELEMNL